MIAEVIAEVPADPNGAPRHHIRHPVGEAVHQSLVLASALGYGGRYVPALVQAQKQLTGTVIVPRPA